jgi:hypothetical protein
MMGQEGDRLESQGRGGASKIVYEAKDYILECEGDE